MLAAIPPRTVTEHRSIVDVLGLVLAEPDRQPDGAAAVGQLGDGWVRDPRRRRARPRPRTRRLRSTVIGEVRAGIAPKTAVERGTAIRIATGAPIPPGADAVVQVELTTPTDAVGRRQRAARSRRHRCAAGADPGPPGGVAPARRSDGRGSDLAEGVTILRARHGDHRGRRRPRFGCGCLARLGLPASTRRGARDRRRDRARRPGPGPGRDPGRQRPGPRGPRGRRRRRIEPQRDRARPARRRPGPPQGVDVGRPRRDHRVGRRLGRAVRRRPDRVRGDRHDRDVEGRRPAGQAVRVRDGDRSARATRRPCSSACPGTRSRAS